jgi:hypothetical protein
MLSASGLARSRHFADPGFLPLSANGGHRPTAPNQARLLSIRWQPHWTTPTASLARLKIPVLDEAVGEGSGHDDTMMRDEDQVKRARSTRFY